jgi:hypothetical protein
MSRRISRGLLAVAAVVAVSAAWHFHATAQEERPGRRRAVRAAPPALEEAAQDEGEAPRGRGRRAPAGRPGRPPAHGGGHAMHGGEHDECARACSDCQRACDSCANHCAQMVMQGAPDHLTTLQSCLDCAEICAAASRIVSRGGPFGEIICKACADACAACGKNCEQFPDDEHMAQCAKVCRECEQECREMVGQAGHAGQPDANARPRRNDRRDRDNDGDRDSDERE